MQLLSTAVGALAVLIVGSVVLLATVLAAISIPQAGGVDAGSLPPVAAAELGTISATARASCPELPPVWVVAHVHAESGWDPEAFSADSNGGAAGLLQMNQANWRASGGTAWGTSPPPPTADILQPSVHLRLAIPWVCANLRFAAAHLRATGKPTPPLDAMLVCHIAGCGRVTGSRTGVPVAGEAGCDARCADLVHRYLDHVHDGVARFGATASDAPAPTPPDDRGTGCSAPDPTGGRCLTPTTRHAYDEVLRAFGPPGPGATVRSAGCWDAHAWNPTSDHPRGRACDFFPTTAGRRPQGDELRAGWNVANWLRANASTLGVSYVIWQGRIWSPGDRDAGGWGRAYTGGGVYDATDVTGGHFDHIHLSVER